jgi:predicted metal-dependent phosphoesterase TrpH
MNKPFLLAEFHCHTVFSADSLLKVPDLVMAAKRKQLERVAVTDHNSIQGALRAKELDPERIIIGEEIETSQGEILGYFMVDEIPPGLHPMEVIARLKDQQAFISLPHPFDRLRAHWQPQTLREMLPYLDALEVFNARCISRSYNRAADAFACGHQLQRMAGSDAHTVTELGRAAMRIQRFDTAEELREVLGTAELPKRLSSASVHLSSSWAKWVKQWRVKQFGGKQEL